MTFIDVSSWRVSELIIVGLRALLMLCSESLSHAIIASGNVGRKETVLTFVLSATSHVHIEIWRDIQISVTIAVQYTQRSYHLPTSSSLSKPCHATL